MNILFINIFVCVGIMVYEIPRGSVFGYFSPIPVNFLKI